MVNPLLQHNASIALVHDDTQERFGPFRTKTGGAKTGENTLVRPGDMAPPIAVAGTYAFDPVTIAKALEHEVDSGIVQKFYGWHGDRVTIIVQSLDSKGRPGFHAPDSYGGRINTSTPPEVDADGNDPQVLEVEVTVDSVT